MPSQKVRVQLMEQAFVIVLSFRDTRRQSQTLLHHPCRVQLPVSARLRQDVVPLPVPVMRATTNVSVYTLGSVVMLHPRTVVLVTY